VTIPTHAAPTGQHCLAGRQAAPTRPMSFDKPRLPDPCHSTRFESIPMSTLPPDVDDVTRINAEVAASMRAAAYNQATRR